MHGAALILIQTQHRFAFYFGFGYDLLPFPKQFSRQQKPYGMLDCISYFNTEGVNQ
jgi:hypothetical protein